MLRPPPPAARLLLVVSFQATSELPANAEPPLALFVELQDAATSRNSLPPIPVTDGRLAGISTASPRVAIARASYSQSAAPLSPLAARIVMPWTLARCPRAASSCAACAG